MSQGISLSSSIFWNTLSSSDQTDFKSASSSRATSTAPSLGDCMPGEKVGFGFGFDVDEVDINRGSNTYISMISTCQTLNIRKVKMTRNGRYRGLITRTRVILMSGHK